MMGFVVPIKAKSISKDWNFDNQLLERTVKSICSQLDQNFKLIIVHHEKPHINFGHSNIIYLQFSLPIIRAAEIEDFDSYVSKYHSADYAEKMMDKGKKITLGCKLAKQLGCKYIMAVDSDDLVSNKIAGIVNSTEDINCPGWRISTGYMYEESQRLLLVNSKIWGINGSTHIIREDLIEIPDPSSNSFWSHSLFEAHGYTRDRIFQFSNEYLKELKLPGIIYVIHKNNASGIQHLLRSKARLKRFLKILLYGKLLNKSIQKEFGLYFLKRQRIK